MQIDINRSALRSGLPVMAGLLMLAEYDSTVALVLAVGLGLVLELLVWRPWPWTRRARRR